MEIFQSEIEDGLAEIVKASASITYASLAEPSEITNKNDISHIKSIASYDDSDLYYVQSILVSSSWNRNDDIFDKEEVWIARKTPEDKPTNLDHDENRIIGHITANWPITEDGVLIDENTPLDNIPNKYHILTGSVIYKGFTDPELKTRSTQLISEIESGQKYVSMECFFRGFDYGLINKSTGEYKILNRNTETAYLTKYLRAYGGLGEHQDHKIGRVLRSITFTGKGFVNKPANPDSIIFTKNSFENLKQEKNQKMLITGVSIFQSTPNVENHTMSSENTVVETEVTKEVDASVAELQAKTTELETALKAQEVVLTETQASLEAIKLEKEEAAKKMDEEMKKKEDEMKKMKAELDSAIEAIAAYKSKEEEMMKKEKKMKRMAALVEAGIESESAEATADKFDSLDDEAFSAMTSLLAAKKVPPFLKEEKKEEKKETKADTSVLDNVEVDETEVDLSVGGETESSVESTRAALVEFVCARLGKKLNKGE
jgi:hypothetical protein